MVNLTARAAGRCSTPSFARYLGAWVSAQTVAVLAQAAEPFAFRGGTARTGVRLARALLATGLLGLLEREVFGQDVPGANDNASGSAFAAALAVECATARLEGTRIVLLLTGCEESGTLGAQPFLDAHDTSGWLFVNFDDVGGAATLRYLRREGVISKFRADASLVAVAEGVASGRPELRLAPTDSAAGLTYDTSAVIARGRRALSLSAQDGFIPDLHWPTDAYENVYRDAIDRTLETGREMSAAIDRDEAVAPSA